jgi:PAS domain S-box-containing protein
MWYRIADRPLRIGLVYLLSAAIGLLLAGGVVRALAGPGALGEFQKIQGWLVLGSTAVLLPWLLRREERQRARTGAQHEPAVTEQTAQNPLALLDLLPVGVAILDANQTVTYLNPAQAALLGRPASDVLGQPLAAFQFLDSAGERLPAEAFPGAQAALQGHSVLNQETGLLSDDGKIRWLNLSVVPVNLPNWKIVAVAADVTERRNTEQALRESEERLRTVTETAQVGLVIVDSGHRYRFANRAYATMFHLSPAEIVGKHCGDVLAPVYETQVKPQLERAFCGEQVGYEVNFPAHEPDWQQRFYSVRYELTYDRGDRVMTAVVLDITQRKQAEQRLREQANLLDQVSDAIISIDGQGRIKSWNAAAETLYGWPAHEVLGKAMAEVLPTTYLDSDFERSSATLIAEGQWQGEVLQPDRSGATRTIMSSVRMLRNAEGDMVGAIGINRDIAEHKRAEQALRQSDERFAKAFRTSPSAMLITRARDGAFIDVNTSYERLFGYSRDELIGQTGNGLEIYTSPDQRETIVRMLRAEGRIRDLELLLRTKSGELRTVFSSLESFELGGEVFLLGTMIDITERKRAEEALEAERATLARRVDERTADLMLANAELARAARLKDEFLANMSHELRTPLNSILGRSEALQEGIYGMPTPKQAQALQGIEASGRHLLALINDILDLSKLEAEKLDLQIEPVAVETLCQASMQMVAQSAAQKRLSTRLTIDPALDIIAADERRLKQILVNLLANAVKFTPEGGTVALAAEGNRESGTATFTVRDTGIGIAEDDQQRLFKSFVQIDSSLSRQYEGTGLGLVLVKRLAEAHGGTVQVESAIGQGSQFRVILPWQLVQPASASAPFMPPELASRDIQRALVIDDSPSAVQQIARYFAELGTHVDVHPHGSGALERAIALQPDLIVLDILLPDQVGWEVLRALKAEPSTSTIPVLVVSVLDEPERARDLGAAALLLKPLDRDRLVRSLHDIGWVPSADHVALVLVPRAAPLHILLAEDNAANAELMEYYLAAKGYQVTVVAEGEQVLERAGRTKPALILLDIQMPGIDGFETMRRIRADRSLAHVPVIALTALAMPGDRERCLAAGANGYLAKPVNLQELVITIEAYSDQARGSDGAASA